MKQSKEHKQLKKLLPGSWLTRAITTWITTAIGLSLLNVVLSDFYFDSTGDAIAAAFVVGVVNALIAPTIASLAVPVSVLTLGLASIVIDGALIVIAINIVPGAHIDGLGAGIIVAVGLTVFNTLVSALFAIDDDAWFDQRLQRRIAKSAKKHDIPTKPGLVVVQIDGLAFDVLRRAIRNGDAPYISKMVREGTHNLHHWETDWSSQTGASQCAILMGSNDNMPAFRWWDREQKKAIVSNSMSSAAYLESLHPRENALLANDGASFGNIFTGGAERAILTMSVAGKRKGKIGAGYGPYFSQPYNATRTAVRFVSEIFSEWRGKRIQDKRDIQPSIKRDWLYAFARAFTTAVQQDVCIDGVLGEMAAGRSIIYVDLLGYDEVAHHAGPERFDALHALRSIDAQIKRIHRATASTKRPYRLVLLSDHGQSQGATFLDAQGLSLEQLVFELTGTTNPKSDATEVPVTEGQKFFQPDKKEAKEQKKFAASIPIRVMASGNLGLVYFTDSDTRLSLEDLNERYPNFVEKLSSHPGIGFILVNSKKDGAVCIGPNGTNYVEQQRIEGEDPLAPFGKRARDKVLRTHNFKDVGDLMINGSWDEDTQSTGAFEELVGSHGGMGGEQMYPFMLVPDDLVINDEIFGAEQVHATLAAFRDSLSTLQERL